MTYTAQQALSLHRQFPGRRGRRGGDSDYGLFPHSLLNLLHAFERWHLHKLFVVLVVVVAKYLRRSN